MALDSLRGEDSFVLSVTSRTWPTDIVAHNHYIDAPPQLAQLICDLLIFTGNSDLAIPSIILLSSPRDTLPIIIIIIIIDRYCRSEWDWQPINQYELNHNP